MTLNKPRTSNLEPRTVLVLAGIIALSGCTGSGRQPAEKARPGGGNSSEGPVSQQMERFSMVGYAENGERRWELQGVRASVEGQEVVSIRQPSGIGYEADAESPDPAHPRLAYLTASVGQINQQTRRVRMEDRVTIHTSDGLWLAAPTLYWLPDQNQVLTDQPVQLETDRMLLRARGATGQTELKEAVFHRDIELFMVPESRTPMAAGKPSQAPPEGSHVRITCDGPLSFYYTRRIAVFQRRVHVQDAQGDLYSDKLIAYLDEPRKTIRYAEALGRVRIVQAGHTARSERAVYDPRRGAVTLVGTPSVRVDRDGPVPAQPVAVQKPKQVPTGTAPQAVPAGEGLPLQSPRR